MDIRERLIALAEKYETPDFLPADPSRFMHEVEGDRNREATAFVAACLSFGSRKQFLPKIASLIDMADRDVDGWIRSGKAEKYFKKDDNQNFYRFYTNGDIHRFFADYRHVMEKYGTIGEYVRRTTTGDSPRIVKAICEAFSGSPVVPKDAKSCCKRVCMFLRWMVRDNSPVDLGLWADFVDKRSLVIPMDVHVRDEAKKLGLVKSDCTSMAAAVRLTEKLREIFPDDPLKADFALFGLGVSRG
ncbi:MAG: TIGR02757 family protein [Kiritimatiellae bacterium]|nr:TIGR02757 family protein [Kiritimatiellia bacterium]